MAGKPTYEELEKRIRALENELLESKHKQTMPSKEDPYYRTLFEAASDAIFIMKDFRVADCNRMTLSLFGCESKEDLFGTSPWDFSQPRQPDGSSSRQKSMDLMRACLKGDPVRFFWRHTRKDGSDIDVEVSLNRLGEGHENTIQAIVRDISGIRAAEQALRENEEKYRILFDLESDALALIDIETGRMLEVNKAFIDLYGYSRQEVLEMKNTDFSAEPDRTRHVTRSRDTYVPVRYHRKKDGTVFPTEITANILKYRGRDVHIAAIRDISERKRLEERLQRSQKMESLGLLAGGVAHDLNNVLSGVATYPGFLLMKIPEDSELRQHIEIIQEAGQRAAAIVEDLLTIARGVASNRIVFNLNDAVVSYLRSPEFKKLKQYHSAISFTHALDPDLLNMTGSPVHIRKVIMNLASNAAEAVDDVGKVVLSTQNRYLDAPLKGYDDVTAGEYVVLSVKDNGKGISPDALQRIFEPFYTKKVMGRSGTGLGLTVVWNVVQDHKGYIDIASDGTGTCFDLYFPITREAITAENPPRGIENYRGKGESILVVDDMQNQREIASNILEALGYSVFSVSSGSEALDYMKDHPVDLVVLDMIMEPGMNGRETYERMLEINPAQKAIIVSGFAETEDVRQTLKAGAGCYVKKPFTLEKIGQAVRETLDASSRNGVPAKGPSPTGKKD